MKCQICGDRGHETAHHPGLVVVPLTEADTPAVLDMLKAMARTDLRQALSFIDARLDTPNLTDAEKQPWIERRAELVAKFAN